MSKAHRPAWHKAFAPNTAVSIHTALFRHRRISILPPLNAFQAEKACPKVREGSSQTPLKRALWLEMLIPQPVPTGTPPNHTSEAFGVLSNTRGTAHVLGSPEQRLEQMQSIEHIPSPGCIAARGSAGTSAPASPAPSTHLASSAISSGGARAGSRHRHPPGSRAPSPTGQTLVGQLETFNLIIML